MDTRFRDNTIAKNRLILRLALIWAASSSLIALVLTTLCFYVVLHKETHWLPMCSSGQYQISQKYMSPNYIRDIAERVVDLRLTYNKDTVESRFDALLMLVEVGHMESLKNLLKDEQKTIVDKDIASVFYVQGIALDIPHQKAKVHGKLAQASHGIALPDAIKTYELTYTYKSGLISILSMKEVTDEKE